MCNSKNPRCNPCSIWDVYEEDHRGDKEPTNTPAFQHLRAQVEKMEPSDTCTAGIADSSSYELHVNGKVRGGCKTVNTLTGELYCLLNTMKLGSEVCALEDDLQKFVYENITQRVEAKPPDGISERWYELMDSFYDFSGKY